MLLHKQKLLFGLAGAALTLALSGCGGNSLSQNSVAPSPYSDPVVQGLEPAVANGAGAGSVTSQFEETSGLGSADGTIGYITAAVDSDSAAIPAVALSPSPSNPNLITTPLGFAVGGQYFSSRGGAPFLLADGVTPAFQAAAPNVMAIFRASIAVGVDPTTSPPSAPPIVASSVKLTSTDPAWSGVSGLKMDDPKNAPNGYLPMAFDVAFSKAPSGPLANGNYVTGTPDGAGNLTGAPTPFAVPFNTPGLHNLRVTVADTRNVVHHTDFSVLVLTPDTSAILAQIVTSARNAPLGGAFDAKGNPAGPATVSLDGSAKTVAFDPNNVPDPVTNPTLTGTVLFLTTPGSHTITVTGATTFRGAPLTYAPTPVTTTGGQVYSFVTTPNGTSGFRISPS